MTLLLERDFAKVITVTLSFLIGFNKFGKTIINVPTSYVYGAFSSFLSVLLKETFYDKQFSHHQRFDG